MRIENEPFSNRTRYEECKSKYITLDKAKTMIPRVSYNKFYEACRSSDIPYYLHDAYYLHYLCIMGNMVRLRNFILDLEERELSPKKIVNYTLLPEFNFGTCFHTALWWNDDPNVFIFLRQRCGGEVRLTDGTGMEPSDYLDFNYCVYRNPFSKILGDGELVFDKFKLYLRHNRCFRRMRVYLRDLRRELEDLENESEGESSESEEEEEEEERNNNNDNLENLPDLIDVDEQENAAQDPNVPYFNNQNNNENQNNNKNLNYFRLGNYAHLLERQPGANPDEEEEKIVVEGRPLVPRQLAPEFDKLVENDEKENKEEEERLMEHGAAPMEDIRPLENEICVPNKIYYDLEKVVKEMDVNNDIINNIVFAFIEIGLKNEEDIITPKFEHEELVNVGVLDAKTIDKIWDYIEEKSPNFVHGDWIN